MEIPVMAVKIRDERDETTAVYSDKISIRSGLTSTATAKVSGKPLSPAVWPLRLLPS